MTNDPDQILPAGNMTPEEIAAANNLARNQNLPIVGVEPMLPAVPQIYTSETIADYAGAMAVAQGDFPEIPKDRTVEVQTRKGDNYSYKYSTLGAIIKAVTPALSKNGIMLAQPVAMVDGMFGVFTVAIHQSGQWMACFMPFVGTPQGNQDLGKAITYIRRYALQALLGITGEHDDDANGPDGNEVAGYSDSWSPQGQPPQQNPPQRGDYGP